MPHILHSHPEYSMSEKAFDNEMKFALFENDKGDNPKRPDRRGTIQINGVEYKLSGWISTDKNGRRYLRGSVDVAQAKPANPVTKPQATIAPEQTDDVPF